MSRKVSINKVGVPDSDNVVWLDIKAPFFGKRIDTSAGHIDYNKDELGIDFDDSSRYNDNDMIGVILQMNHNYKLGTNVRPHIHWLQSSDDIPNMLIEYRVYDNGDTPPAWTKVAWSKNVITYTSGTILQIMEFPEIDMSSITGVSSFIDIKIFRDNNNSTGLFSGADPLSGNALMKEFDVHYSLEMNGSRTEYEK